MGCGAVVDLYPEQVTDHRTALDSIPWLRGVPLVLVPLLLLASSFPGQYQVSAFYWVTAMVAAAVFLGGDRQPLVVSLTLSALSAILFAEHAWGLASMVPYLGAAGLAEAAMRLRRRSFVTLAAAGWTGAVLVDLVTANATFWRAATIIEGLAVVGLPLLLGLYLRAQRELAQTYRARAEQEAARIRTEERTALARELHDLVAHHMSSIVLRIGVARHVVRGADPRVRDVLDDVHATASGALTDIRRLLSALRDPDLGEVDLVERAAVPAEITAAVDRTRAAGLIVVLEPLPPLDRLDAIGRLTVLRVVQESLTNVMKHGDPGGDVHVVVAEVAGEVTIDVSNQTFGVATVGDGHGLEGMAERVALAGGTWHVGTEGDRWRVRAALPIETGETAP